MKQIVYNAQTKETTIVEVPDVEMPVISTTQEPTELDRIDALENVMLLII